MSHPENQETPEYSNEEQFNEEEYVDSNEIAEEVEDDFGPGPEDNEENDMDLDEGETLEIDLANNSWTYFDQHKDSVFVIFRHPSLPMVVTGAGDNTAYMWTTHTQPPRFVGELLGHKESVIAGGFTGDGKFVITGDMNGCIQVHKAAKGGQKWSKFGELEEVEEVLWISVHPELPYFAFGAPDGSVWVYQINEDSKSLEQVMSGFSHNSECNGGVFVNTDNHDSLTLVTISEDGLIVNWNAFSGATNYKLQPHDDFKGVESPWVSLKTYKNVFAVGARDGQLAIVNLDTGRIVHHVKTIENVEDIADLSVEALSWCKNPTVNLLAVGLVSGDVLLFDSLQWRLRRTLKADDTITKLEFVDETPILIGSSMNGKIYKWDARTGEELFVGVGHNMGVLDFAVLDGGSKLVTAGDEGVSLVFVHE
ncbi:ribosome assembly protein SQT1 [Metschnikowia aff. pulcherrima]|uniref:Ribosome assembly protein SQT1 n=1 Tax=Metschnikowia aff. pulcherrima TaxID=2163413 RepID=A0A4P6XRM4_9ASCO|nr:ribosome assembly protein SQT1 [Metschnikowia aff. pulcherrima]